MASYLVVSSKSIFVTDPVTQIGTNPFPRPQKFVEADSVVLPTDLYTLYIYIYIYRPVVLLYIHN